MKITAIIRYKHGELFAILKRVGWTQSELARQSGLDPSMVGSIINLVRRPSVTQANAIQNALASKGEFFDVLTEWPDTFNGLGAGFRHEQTADIPMENLLGCQEALMLPAPDTAFSDEEESIEDAMAEAKLTHRESYVLSKLYLDDVLQAEIASKMGITRGAVSAIAKKAIRKLRHPRNIKGFTKFL